jgi:hypothetical protein
LSNTTCHRLLSKINKLIAHHVNDEEELGDIYDLLCRHLGLTNKAEQTAITRFNNDKIDNNRKIIAINFDGVIHDTHGNEGDKTTGNDTLYNGISIPYNPVKGAINWLSLLANDERFFVTIYSSRSKILGFSEACKAWFQTHGMEKEIINKISFSVTKPQAFLFIDDRSWKFNGKFPLPDDLLTFKAWYEKIV